MQIKEIFKNIASVVAYLVVGAGIGFGAMYGVQKWNEPQAMISMDTSQHFAQTDKSVVIYTTQWCPFCKQLKDYLDTKGIEYLERDIESNDAEILSLYDSIGQGGIPKTLIGNSVINGFHPDLITQELAKINPS